MLKRILSGSIVVAILLSVCQPALAQTPGDPYHVYRLPKASFEVGEDGAEDENGDPVVRGYMCYDLPSFKALLTMDNDLRKAEGQVPNLEAAIQELRLSDETLRLASTQLKSQLVVLTGDRDRILAKWKSENKARHAAENRPTFGSWVPWAISGVLAVGLGGTIAGVVLTSD